MRELLATRNTRHVTIENLDAAIGYSGMIRSLITGAESRGRMPRAELINSIADELEGTHPIEVLVAFARVAGVRLPDNVLTQPMWRRLVTLPDPNRRAIYDVMRTMIEVYEETP